MKRADKEKSILGRINDLSHRMVLMLVIPIIISLVLMLFYAWKYHSSIHRMQTIASLKTVVAEEIPGAAWNIIIFLNLQSVSDLFCTFTPKFLHR